MITVIFTCFTRREKTLQCIKSLSGGNKDIAFQYVIVDDNSTDGTYEALEDLKRSGMTIDVLRGTGNLFWAGGMRKGIAYAKENTDSDYYLLVNDDVDFMPEAISKMIQTLQDKKLGYQKDTVLVGPMCDKNGTFSYGGIRYQNGIHYAEVKPSDEERRCDSFNMNCLLLPKHVFMEIPNFDEHYIHSLADFDYGLEMKRRGIPMYVYHEYVGVCPDNDLKGGWSDTSLSRLERLKKKESIKGAPFKPWFYFLKKNFGWTQALLHGFTPYVRIMLGK